MSKTHIKHVTILPTVSLFRQLPGDSFVCLVFSVSGKFRISFSSMKVLPTAEQFSLLYARHLHY